MEGDYGTRGHSALRVADMDLVYETLGFAAKGFIVFATMDTAESPPVLRFEAGGGS